MSVRQYRAVGWSLIVIGALVTIFSKVIVFPGLEMILGIEAVVGRENVVYDSDGSYVFTNPTAMIRSIALVATFGLALVGAGAYLLFRQNSTSRQ